MSYIEYSLDGVKHHRILLLTDIHNCHKQWYDIKTQDRMELLCQKVKEVYETRPYDAILCLGDYSLDFWGWETGGCYLGNPPVSRTQEFIEKYRSRFPVPSFMIPGNHEQYGNETWEKLAGTPREFAVVCEDYVFAMCDTFSGNLDPHEHSDGTYTGLNVSFLQEVINRHPDKKMILCAHQIMPDQESEAARMLIQKHEQIMCAFAGHIHQSITKILDESWRNLPVFYCGDFSYEMNAWSDKPHWGFRILEWNEQFRTEYVLYDQCRSHC